MDRQLIKDKVDFLQSTLSTLTDREKILTVANYLLHNFSDNIPKDVSQSKIFDGKYIQYELLKYPNHPYLNIYLNAHVLINISEDSLNA